MVFAFLRVSGQPIPLCTLQRVVTSLKNSCSPVERKNSVLAFTIHSLIGITHIIRSTSSIPSGITRIGIQNRGILLSTSVTFTVRFASFSQTAEKLTFSGSISPMGIWWVKKWHATELVQTIRSLQPDILLNNRLESDLRKSSPPVYAGDFMTPEQTIPPEVIRNEEGQPVPWEACITLNDHWGYCAADKNYKSPKQIIRTLVECVSKNENLLLNVGSNALVEFPDEAIAILSQVGAWMKKNGASIYGCGPADLPEPDWGYFTKRETTLYAHILEPPIGLVPLRGVGEKSQ